MTALMTNTIHDLHTGRQTWRVLLLLAIPTFATGIAATMLPWS